MFSRLRGWRPSRALQVFTQTEAADCGLTCLAMILHYHGARISLPDLRARFAVSVRGTSLADLVTIAASMNLVPRAVKAELSQIHQLRAPCILHWDMTHYVVLERLLRGRAVVVDPMVGRRSVTDAELSKHFTGVALELEPTPKVPALEGKRRFGFRELLAPLAGMRAAAIRVLVAAGLAELATLLAPLYLQITVDRVIRPGDINLLPMLGLLFAVAIVIQALLVWLRSTLLLSLNASFVRQWLSTVYGTLVYLPLTYFQARYVSSIIQRFRAVREIQRTLSVAAAESALDGVMATITILVLFFYEPRLALLSIVAFAIYALIRYRVGRRQVHAATELLQHDGQQQAFLHETIRAIQSVKLFVSEPARISRWANLVADSEHRELRVQKLVCLASSLRVAILGLENVATLTLGSLFVMQQRLTLGMFFAYFGFKTMFQIRAFALVDKIADIALLRPHLEQLADVLCSTPEVSSHRPSWASALSTVELQHVAFRYSPLEPHVLKDCSLRISNAETLAIHGVSGSGKSSLIRVVAGLVRATDGKMLVNGHVLEDHDLGWYRGYVGAVMQDDQLTYGTIGENICFSDPRPDLERMQWCARLARIHDDIIKMPMRFDTQCGDMGSTLSGGQRQRILLARALYKQPSFLILDEATSNLDAQNEARIFEHLRDLPMLKIIVAHRQETLAMADRVVTLDCGRIVA